MPPTPKPKGQVYSGVVRLPQSPHADMHGMLWAVIRTRDFAAVTHALSRFSIHVAPEDLGRYWVVSYSAIEHQITATQYGELFTCPLALTFIRPENYRHHPFPKSPLRGLQEIRP